MKHGTKQERRLDHTKILKLGNWLQANAENVKEKTLSEIARMGQADLAFPIPPSSLPRIMEAVGVEHKPPRANPLVDAINRCTVLEQIVKELKERVDFLEENAGIGR